MKAECTKNNSLRDKEEKIARPQALIPHRDKSAAPELVDLSNFYNSALDDDIHHKPGNTLSSLPKGIQMISGMTFDIRGLVQLAGFKSEEITTLVYPESVTGIEVNPSGKRLNFLHAAAWNTNDPQKLIGEYVVHYENGHAESISLVYKNNIWDWWGTPDESDKNVAWKGVNERTRNVGFHIRLFILSWVNPFPDVKIASIDLVSNCQGPGPFVVAITVN
jgi:hypothetical protein